MTEPLSLLDFIKNQTTFSTKSIQNVLQLNSEGASIPFISRYRKEMTGSLDEVQIAEIVRLNTLYKDISDRKTFILQTIEEQGKLTDELRLKIESSFDLVQLEDLYLPYKKRKKTKADIARDNGLEPLAKKIMSQNVTDIVYEAKKYICEAAPSPQSCIEGAQFIIAEWVSENVQNRELLRSQIRKNSLIKSKVVSTKKDEAITYKDYFDYEEPLYKTPSHRLLAVLRGQSEGFLRVSLLVDDPYLISRLTQKYIKTSGECANIIQEAVEDGYKRLLLPSLENQIINEAKEKADREAIEVFGKNLRQLLLASPLGSKNVLAIDPGFRTGCKIVALGSNGDVLDHNTIYPTPPKSDIYGAEHIVLDFINRYRIDSIALGNGTASRETESFLRDLIKTHQLSIHLFVISENGASIYSASDTGREEFPDLDVTVRGAISIGRRLQDPLAELVKIDPKSIGVGQYQHDVNQVLLKEKLEKTVISAVNSVGVDLNTASPHLLQYVSGLGPTLARKIVETRSSLGLFEKREDIKKVPRLGEKVFEQCAGFLRIRNGHNPLDNTGIHPESVNIVNKMAKDLGIGVTDLIANTALINKIQITNYVNERIGLPTLEDIIKELKKPGYDPRGEAQTRSLNDTIRSIADVKPGMTFEGIVGNMTNFGAFVDIGIKENGLLHISQITKKFIKNPSEVLTIGQIVEVKVLEVDVDRKRINLTMMF